MPIETELKLSIHSGDEARFPKLGLFKEYACGRAKRRHLVGIYFDTPDLELRRRRMVLRIRKESGRWIQAVKGPSRQQGGLHQRAEYEHALAGRIPQPEYGLFVEHDHLDVFKDNNIIERLAPRFRTDIWRTTWDLCLPNGSVIEAALDRGEIQTENHSVPVQELELELKRGMPETLYKIAQQVADSIHVRLEHTSKAQRGYDLLTNPKPKPQPVRSSEIRISKSMTVEDVYAVILWNSVEQIHANEDAVLMNSDIEGVHQMRVGLRRFRTCQHLFRKWVADCVSTPLHAELQTLSRYIGPARDWDVFINDHLIPLFRDQATIPGAEELRECAISRRDTVYSELKRFVQSREYHRILLDLAAWIACKKWREAMDPALFEEFQFPAKNVARKMLSRGHKRISKRGRHLVTLSETDLHRLRIEIKRQRYTVEFLNSLFPGKRVQAYRKQLKGLQDQLGVLNDVVTAKRLLHEIDKNEDVPAVAYLLGWFKHIHIEELGSLEPSWKTLKRQAPTW